MFVVGLVGVDDVGSGLAAEDLEREVSGVAVGAGLVAGGPAGG